MRRPLYPFRKAGETAEGVCEETGLERSPERHTATGVGGGIFWKGRMQGARMFRRGRGVSKPPLARVWVQYGAGVRLVAGAVLQAA